MKFRGHVSRCVALSVNGWTKNCRAGRAGGPGEAASRQLFWQEGSIDRLRPVAHFLSFPQPSLFPNLNSLFLLTENLSFSFILCRFIPSSVASGISDRWNRFVSFSLTADAGERMVQESERQRKKKEGGKATREVGRSQSQK